MKRSLLAIALPSALVVIALASVRQSTTGPTPVSYAPDNSLSNSLDLLPGNQPPAMTLWPTTNDVPDADTYLGGSLYARPDGEVFTAPMEQDTLPDASTMWAEQGYYPTEDDSYSEPASSAELIDSGGPDTSSCTIKGRKPLQSPPGPYGGTGPYRRTLTKDGCFYIMFDAVLPTAGSIIVPPVGPGVGDSEYMHTGGWGRTISVVESHATLRGRSLSTAAAM